MNYISDRDYNAQMKAIKRMNQSKEREMKLRKEREKYSFKFKMPSTSKIVLFIVFALCLQILFFCERIMEKTGDLSALYVLIGVPVSLVPICLGYYWKSCQENTSGGIIYDTAMKNAQCNDDASNDDYMSSDPSF